jgi:hypothetical protein
MLGPVFATVAPRITLAQNDLKLFLEDIVVQELFGLGLFQEWRKMQQ